MNVFNLNQFLNNLDIMVSSADDLVLEIGEIPL